MKGLPPSFLRPANLSEVRAPAVLLQTAKYGAPFLVVGDGDEAAVIFLGEEHQFQSFAKSAAANWNGLAVENVEFEIDSASAVDLSVLGRTPGMLIRRAGLLTIAAIADGAFRRTIEIPIQSNLPEGSEGLATGFTKWRAFVTVGKDQRLVWEYSLPVGNE
jgi:hypothetical protein